jgi:hypothetical protein
MLGSHHSSRHHHDSLETAEIRAHLLSNRSQIFLRLAIGSCSADLVLRQAHTTCEVIGRMGLSMIIRNTLPLAEPTSRLCQSWMENINNGISTSMYNGGKCTRNGHGSILDSTDSRYPRRCTLHCSIYLSFRRREPNYLLANAVY